VLGAPEVETKSGRKVRAEHLVVATHMPFLDRGLWWTRLLAKRSYAIAVRTAEWKADAMYLSVDSPTRSVRGARLGDEEVVIVAGEGHTTGEDDDTTRRYAALEEWARERLGATEVTHRWSSQDLQPADGVPYVGPYVPGADRTHVAAGFRKWGLTNGTAAAVVLADRIAGREHPWGALLAADRAAPRQARGILSESLKDARHFVGDRIRQGLGGSADDLAPGEGGIVRGRAGVVAAYRDEDGTLHAVSPTCTHLGCRVRFNTAERTWDCPCHASRFAPDGTVLQGPATSPLGPRDVA
jgi:nitrite reductase/ring-hydroxylating ferredoxin subunit